MSHHQNQEMHEEPEEEEEVAPFWMISFSDMMTLLLTFFIMLYTISTLNANKAQQMSQAMIRQFGYSANMYSPLPGAKFDDGSDNRPEEKKEDNSLLNPHRPVKIESANELLSKGFILFEIGSNQLSPASKKAITNILPSLIGIPQKIELRGHASPDEEGKGFYGSLMDLAYSRAFSIRNFLIESGIKPTQIEIKIIDPGVSASLSEETFVKGLNSSVELCIIVTP